MYPIKKTLWLEMKPSIQKLKFCIKLKAKRKYEMNKKYVIITNDLLVSIGYLLINIYGVIRWNIEAKKDISN